MSLSVADENLRKALSPGEASVADWDNATASSLAWLTSELPHLAREEHFFCAKSARKTTLRRHFLFLLPFLVLPAARQPRQALAALSQKLAECDECFGDFRNVSEKMKSTYYPYVRGPEETQLLADAIDAFYTRTVQESAIGDTPPGAGRLPIGAFSMLLSIPVIFDSPAIPARSWLKNTIEHTPSISVSGPSVGVYTLAMDSDETIRTWAMEQLKNATSAVTTQRYKANGLEAALLSNFEYLGFLDRRSASHGKIFKNCHYTGDPVKVWEAWELIFLTFAPSLLLESILTNKAFQVVSTIGSHLSDTSAQFEYVLACFRITISHISKDTNRQPYETWVAATSLGTKDDRDTDTSQKYEEILLHRILENPAFERTLSDVTEGDLKQPAFSWILPFLTVVASERSSYLSFLAILAITFLENFQQLRLSPRTRLVAIQIIMEVFTMTFVKKKEDWPYAALAHNVLDIHSRTVAQQAFHYIRSNNQYDQAAHRCVLTFVGCLAHKEAANFEAQLLIIAKYEASYASVVKRAKREGAEDYDLPSPPAVFRYHENLWKTCFELLKTDDHDGISILLRALIPVFYIQPFVLKRWKICAVYEAQLLAFNAALAAMTDPVIAKLNDLLDDISSRTLTAFLQLHNNAKYLTILLFSPTESVQSAALDLMKQVFDVSTRAECFYVLMKSYSSLTYKALVDTLERFAKTVNSLPEASNHAKRLVVCFTDVLSVLCDPYDSLLRAQSEYTGTEKLDKQLLTQLWSLMCDDLASIFKKTPDWSFFIEREALTDWMRDALLFGQQLTEQLSFFHLILLEGSQKSSGHILNSLCVGLNTVLYDLLDWLSLMDENLLQMTFDLVLAVVGIFKRYKNMSGFYASISTKTIEKLSALAERRSNSRYRGRRVYSNEQLRELVLLANQVSELSSIETIELSDDDDKDETVPKQRAPPTTVKRGDASGYVVSGPAIKPPQKPQGSGFYPIFTGAKPSSQTSALVTKTPLKTAPAASWQTPATTATSVFSRPKSIDRTAYSSLAVANPKKPAALPRPRGVPWTSYSSSRDPNDANAWNNRSESESSEDDDEDVPTGSNGEKLNGLQLLAQTQKVPHIRKPEARRVQLLPSMINDDRKRLRDQAQLAKSANALLGFKDYSDLHRHILQWDVDSKSDLPLGMSSLPPRLPRDFNSAEDYIKAFEEYLYLETWASFRQARELSSTESVQISFSPVSVLHNDDFVTISGTIDHGQFPDTRYISQTSVVLLEQKSTKLKALAKIENSTRRREYYEVVVKCHFGTDTSMASRFYPKSEWTMLYVYSLSTVLREFSALQTVGYLRLVDDILKPKLHAVAEPDEDVMEATVKTYKVNKPQAIAIQSALKTHGFSLIQGPPGTGKTKTILSLVGLFLDMSRGVATDKNRPDAKRRVLICAPSNAAVDEIVKRLKQGIPSRRGGVFVPNVVRIGSETSLDVGVRDVFIDTLVDIKLGGQSTRDPDIADKIGQLKASVQDLVNQRNEKIQMLEMGGVTDAEARKDLADDLKRIKSQINNSRQQVDTLRDKEQQSRRAMDASKLSARSDVLTEADVICSTLSGAGHEYMSSLPFNFETVIIDEAAQSVELSALIPLKYSCKQCILVGDPLQLPPTLFSTQAAKRGYERSLFARMMENDGKDSNMHLLSIQYRMHPDISAFPAKEFYQGLLKDGPDMAQITQQPWHKDVLFPPYVFMHVKNGRESAGGFNSIKNTGEAAVAVALYRALRQQNLNIDFDQRIGIVTPYKAQVNELRNKFQNAFGSKVLDTISFNTIDGFQGQEKDIIILSCVRGGSLNQNIGFLSDRRRMNVALTRARSSLFVLGDATVLRSQPIWSNLVRDAEDRRKLIVVEPRLFTLPSSWPDIKSVKTVAGQNTFQTLGNFAVSSLAQSVTTTSPGTIATGTSAPVTTADTSLSTGNPLVSSTPSKSITLPAGGNSTLQQTGGESTSIVTPANSALKSKEQRLATSPVIQSETVPSHPLHPGVFTKIDDRKNAGASKVDSKKNTKSLPSRMTDIKPVKKTTSLAHPSKNRERSQASGVSQHPAKRLAAADDSKPAKKPKINMNTLSNGASLYKSDGSVLSDAEAIAAKGGPLSLGDKGKLLNARDALAKKQK